MGRAPRKTKGKKKIQEVMIVSRKRNTVSNFMRPMAFPKSRVVKMRYVQHTAVLNTAAISGFYYRMNSIFDPLHSVGGIQPLGHDEWNQFYNNYVVLGSQLRAEFVRSGVGTTTASMTGTTRVDDTAIPASYTHMIELGKGTYKALSGSLESTATHVIKYSPKNYFGITDVKDNQDDIGAAFGADPDKEALVLVYAQALDLATAGTAINVVVTIDYIVSLSNPKELAQS